MHGQVLLVAVATQFGVCTVERANFSVHEETSSNKERNLMRFKRLLMPMLVLGIMVTLSSMAFGQASPINCSLSAPQGASAHATATGHAEPIGAGLVEIPLGMTTVYGGGPVTAVREAGGGTVRVTCVNTSAAIFNPGVVVLTFQVPVPITNTQSHPSVPAGIRVDRGTGDFLTAGATSGASIAGKNVGISSVSNSNGQVVIGLGTGAGGSTSSTSPAVNPTVGIPFSACAPGPFPACTTAGISTFDLEGVLVSTNGKTGNIVAALSSTGGVNITTGTAEVITALFGGLELPTVPTGTLPTVVTSLPTPPGSTGIAGGAAVLNSNGGAVKNNFTIRIQEAYPSMFKESAQFNSNGVFPVSPSSDTQVQVLFNNIPAGFDISECKAALTDVNGNTTGVTGSPTAATTNVSSASPIISINFNAEPVQDQIDVLWLTCTKVGVGTAALPLPSTSITAQVTLGPSGSPLSSTSTALTGLTTGLIPRYQTGLLPATPLTVVVFPAANTVLLTTFAFVGPGYNTGLAIANTTTDPFGTAAGGAAASEGTVTFFLAKNDGTTKTYTTGTGSPGGGLTGAGVVKTGSTYVVNLSEILNAASFGTTFTGYVFITANFTHAHGAATIYTTSNGAAALSTPVTVMPSVSSAVPRVTPESNGQ